MSIRETLEKSFFDQTDESTTVPLSIRLPNHLNNELEEFGTVSVLEIVPNEGNREVLRSLEHYNLDIILAVG